MKWISVLDRKPDKRQRVLCFSDIIYVKTYEDEIFYDGDTEFYCPVGIVINVTHWMPCPNPPKE